MSKHAEFEAALRDLPPILSDSLKFFKTVAIQELRKTYEKKKPGEALDTINENELLAKKDDYGNIKDDKEATLAGAVCVLDPEYSKDCVNFTEHTFNNLCLVESITNGKDPRFVCDADWITTIGADNSKIKKFVGGYDQWKATFLKSVKWLLQNQAAIKLKRNVCVPLGYRQANSEGIYLDNVCFEENAWNKAFSKLQPATKISEQSLWLLAYLFHTERTAPKTVDGLQEICTFVGRSIEVRTDTALSALKIFVYGFELLKEITIDTFDKFEHKELLQMSLTFGNPQYLLRLVEQKPNLEYEEQMFSAGLFLAMHEDNQPLFDFLLTKTIVSGAVPDKNMLPVFALNSMKFKNNDAYFCKLLAASGASFVDFIDNLVEIDEYANFLQGFERRLILRNPFLNTLKIGNQEENKEFLKKVKRTASITVM